MSTKGMNRAKFEKLTAMMDNPSRAEAIAAFGLALDELAKEQDARFSVEYALGNPEAEEAAQEMERLRAELSDALESVSRHETTTKQLEETIDRLHEKMAEVDEHFQPVEHPQPGPPDPPQPTPIEHSPAMPFEWGEFENDDRTENPTQPRLVHSVSFGWSTVAAWTYGFALVFWLAMVSLPWLRNAYSFLFLPLLFVLVAVPVFLYLRKLRDDHGWIGVAVKVCLTADILLGLMLFWLAYRWVGEPAFTSRERFFVAAVVVGLLWFLYTERFFTWVLDERKRTQVVAFPGAALLLMMAVAWVNASDSKPVKASVPPPHVLSRKHHPAPKPTPPPDDPHKLDYDFELPARDPSPLFLQASYSPTTARPYLVAAAFQSATPSDNGSGGVLALLVVGGLVFLVRLVSQHITQQRRERYQKALDEASAPLPENEKGNAGHASKKDLRKRGWA